MYIISNGMAFRPLLDNIIIVLHSTVILAIVGLLQ